MRQINSKFFAWLLLILCESDRSITSKNELRSSLLPREIVS